MSVLGNISNAFSNFNTWHNGYILTYPYIIANHCISLKRQLFYWWHDFFPTTCKDIKRVGCYAIHSMICSIHNEFYSLCYCTKFAYD